MRCIRRDVLQGVRKFGGVEASDAEAAARTRELRMGFVKLKSLLGRVQLDMHALKGAHPVQDDGSVFDEASSRPFAPDR
jgi:hypothetical protein